MIIEVTIPRTTNERNGDIMRLQLAINVSDLDEAVDFYTRLFATEPVKIKPGYANFAIADPPLKLVLFENPAEGGSLNHLGVETTTAAEVVAAEERLRADGLATTGVDDTVCCFADKTETWVTAPDAVRWEYYVKNADVDAETAAPVSVAAPGPWAADAGICCAPGSEGADEGAGAGCCG
ncbi:MAG: VOC family protein [Acidimicrobiia bacterium]|nr:VOC family protein [Acidimicrobiia bacterium]